MALVLFYCIRGMKQTLKLMELFIIVTCKYQLYQKGIVTPKLSKTWIADWKYNVQIKCHKALSGIGIVCTIPH